ncbi:MAG: esterase-like activity of phytase family protein [Cyclobacteriaceae bacterium]|nr:esterase-like activity of phytase family protein [Cyclobacteriaceae bacterium]
MLKIALIAFFFVLRIGDAQAQEIDTLVYAGISIISHNKVLGKEVIQELSGIEYTGTGNTFYVIPQSKKRGHIFLGTILFLDTGMEVTFDSILYLNHEPLEAEAIRINPNDKQLYIAEEGDRTSYIYRVKKDYTLEIIYTSSAAQRHNRGYEGLCFSPDGAIMYMGLERPKSGNITYIIAYDLATKNEKVYNYPLDVLPNDKRADNGITELLTLNDSTLLVVERAYLGSKNSNSVRVYKAIIPSNSNDIKKVKLLTNFSASPKIDNIEGVCWSASGKELIFISDNNGNPYQQTLFISMKIE